ncbi:MAG: hypothetical protein ACK5HT_14520 [Draconibacterium sp.]
MKPTILKLSALFLSLLFIGAGCNNDEDLFELQIGDKNAVIQQEVNGIEFTFCLLNEAGEPATVFNEGENFTFQFTITNNTDTVLYNDVSLFDEEGFCEIKNNEGSSGMSFDKPVAVELIGKVAFRIPVGSSVKNNILWIPNNDVWTEGHVSFKKNNNSYLTKGVYYTQFSHRFSFDTKQTHKLTFKINFQVK